MSQGHICLTLKLILFKYFNLKHILHVMYIYIYIYMNDKKQKHKRVCTSISGTYN